MRYSDEPYVEGEAGDDTLDETDAVSADDNAETTENGDDRPRRKRRRRGRGGRRDGRPGGARDEFAANAPEGEDAPADAVANEEFQDGEGSGGEDDDDETPSSGNEPRSEGDRKRRRRGRRGGRRRRTTEEGGVGAVVNEIEGVLEPVEVEVATADLDGVARQFPPAQLTQEPAPVAAPAATSAPASEDTSQPRRRSTVREKVSFSFGDQDASAIAARVDPRTGCVACSESSESSGIVGCAAQGRLVVAPFRQRRISRRMLFSHRRAVPGAGDPFFKALPSNRAGNASIGQRSDAVLRRCCAAITGL